MRQRAKTNAYGCEVSDQEFELKDIPVVWRYIGIAVILAGVGLYVLLAWPTIRKGTIGPVSGICQKLPAFASSQGIKNAAFDTSRRGQTGLVMYDADNPQKIFQADSWKSAGSLGPIAYDGQGDIYVAPVPNINTLNNPPDQQNTIYKVDAQTADMSPFYVIKDVPTPNQQNPYGILSLVYDCESQVMYASTISGSTEKQSKGAIVALDTKTGKEIARLKGVDALSIAIYRDDRGTELFYGSADKSQVWRVGVSKSGAFVGKPEYVLEYDKFNELKPRKLVFDDASSMQIHTTEFRYNLIASTEFRQQYITYKYDSANNHWTQTKVEEAAAQP